MLIYLASTPPPNLRSRTAPGPSSNMAHPGTARAASTPRVAGAAHCRWQPNPHSSEPIGSWCAEVRDVVRIMATGSQSRCATALHSLSPASSVPRLDSTTTTVIRIYFSFVSLTSNSYTVWQYNHTIQLTSGQFIVCHSMARWHASSIELRLSKRMAYAWSFELTFNKTSDVHHQGNGQWTATFR